MSKFSQIIKKSISKNIDNYTTIRTGKITADNGDGTYDVRIANASSAMPDIETMYYDDVFSVGEIVDIGFEYGSKESPKIMGHAKKIAQEPKEVEVDYSGGGAQTVTVTLYAILFPNSLCCFGNAQDDSYSQCHNSVDGSGLGYFIIDYMEYIDIGQAYRISLTNDDYWIFRGYILIDTSSIPINANITIAILSPYISFYDPIGTDFNVVIQDGQPNYPHNPVIASDYDYSKYVNNGGQINTANINENAYNPITLNANGRAWINKGGMTKFFLRSSQDIAGIPPAIDEYNIIEINQTTNATKLTITYTI